MPYVTIRLPDDLNARLRLEAKRLGKTISGLTREIVTDHLGRPKRQLRAAGTGRSGHHDLSDRIEDIDITETAH